MLDDGTGSNDHINSISVQNQEAHVSEHLRARFIMPREVESPFDFQNVPGCSFPTMLFLLVESLVVRLVKTKLKCKFLGNNIALRATGIENTLG